MDDKRTIIFDFDGTLADTWELVAMLAPKYWKKITSVPYSPDELERVRYMPMGDIFKKYRISLWNVWWMRKEIMKDVKLNMANLKIFPGIAEMLHDLKGSGYRLMILTSNDADNVRGFLNRYDLNLFEAVVSERNLMGKAAGLKKMMKKYHVDPSMAYYVGDETRDVEAGRKAGMTPIAVSWGYNRVEILQKYSPALLAASTGEILKYVKSG